MSVMLLRMRWSRAAASVEGDADWMNGSFFVHCAVSVS